MCIPPWGIISALILFAVSFFVQNIMIPHGICRRNEICKDEDLDIGQDMQYPLSKEIVGGQAVWNFTAGSTALMPTDSCMVLWYLVVFTGQLLIRKSYTNKKSQKA